MDLKIKDLAELLNVSEKTIRRWLADGKIPAYKLNQQYRFNPQEIEEWVMKNRLNKQGEEESDEEDKQEPPATGGSKQFSLYRSINLGGVFYKVSGSTKEEVIRTSMKALAQGKNLDADHLTELLLEREKLAPTALNFGIGVPHTRDYLINSHQNMVAVAFPETPISYGALDDVPVHTLFFLFACNEKQHLHLLAKIAHLSSKPEAINFLLGKPSKLKLLEFIKEWEQKIPIRA